jgi:kynureninase
MSMAHMTTAGENEAARLDAEDPLAGFRERFVLPDDVIYLDGNSLGALPRATAARVQAVATAEWGTGLIRSWNSADWIGAPARVGAKIARLVGAAPHEVIVADSTSVNLYKLIVAALQSPLAKGRSVILSEPGNFPTDLYMIESAMATLGGRHRLELVPRDGLSDRMRDDVALVLLTHVHYKTAERYDMVAMTAAAHAAGALVCWDLSHSTGAVVLDLASARADFAVGCGYKFLNGGPGAPAFLYVAERHQSTVTSPLGGWMGHAQPFAFADQYAPAPGIARFLCGTPPILSMAALECGVDLHLEAEMALVEAKSRALATYFIDQVGARCGGHDLELIGPSRGAPRGSHVSWRHPQAYAVMQALIARGVIGDFRAPDAMRFGLTPLYLRFTDIAQAVEILAEVLTTRMYEAPRFQVRQAVT